MLNYDKYLNDFNSRYFNRILDNKDKLIRAFTIYYGEKYSYKINELINSTNYYCFIPSDFYKLLPIIRDKRYDEEVDITYQIISLLGISKIKEINDGVLGDIFVKKGNLGIYLNKMSNVYNQNGELIDDILTAIFGDTNMFHYYYEIIPLYNFFNLSDEKQKEFVKKVFKSDTVSKKIAANILKAINYMDELIEKNIGYQKYLDVAVINKNYQNKKQKKKKKTNHNLEILQRIIGSTTTCIPNFNLQDIPFASTTYDDPPIIALPYLLMNDEFLIHELNHVLTTEIPILLENDNKSGYIEKLGIEAINCIDKIVHTANEKELIFEEVLNERSSLDITEIFHQLGGSIYDDANSFDIKMKAFYRDLIPLIEPFYQQYKEIIKEARITSNANILYKYINKDVFNELKYLIGQIFKKIYNDNGNITDDDIENVTRLVELLPRDYFEEIDNDTYLNELESKGYKVKKLKKTN